MKKLTITMALLVSLVSLSSVAMANEGGCSIGANEALEKLTNGNNNYVEMQLKHPNQTKERRAELTKGQHPFAAVLSCSDSRVPTEIVFDQGLGDIFVIRNAGNVADEHVIGSVEYAIAHAGVKLVVVMGHDSCGAVGATIAHSTDSPSIISITKSIEPALKISKGQGCEFANNVAKNNAILTANKIIQSSPIVKEYIKEHGVKVVPAIYHLDSGKVEFLCK